MKCREQSTTASHHESRYTQFKKHARPVEVSGVVVNPPLRVESQRESGQERMISNEMVAQALDDEYGSRLGIGDNPCPAVHRCEKEARVAEESR